jgi:uncharacterized membrane protein required for colicin V production
MLAFPRAGLSFEFMIAAATEFWRLDKLPFGWFDVLFVIVLAFGVYRGRKNGLTKELLPTLRWIAIVLAGSLGYEFAGQILYNFTGLGRAGSDCLGYLTLAFIVYMLFVPMEGYLKARLEGSSLFGATEYYLGMAAGMVRYLCILLSAMALTNAPRYTAAEIQAQKEADFQTFGGGEQGFTGDFFPTFQQVQESVFKKSQIGPLIADHLAVVLISTAPASVEKKPVKSH